MLTWNLDSRMPAHQDHLTWPTTLPVSAQNLHGWSYMAKRAWLAAHDACHSHAINEFLTCSPHRNVDRPAE